MVNVVDLIITVVLCGRGRSRCGQGVAPPDQAPAGGEAVEAAPARRPVLQRKLRYQGRLLLLLGAEGGR